MKNYIKILIPTIPLVIVPTLITSCNRPNKQQYLDDVFFQHTEYSDVLALYIKFPDWNYSWETTDVSFTTKAADFLTNCVKDDNKRVRAGYIKMFNTNPDYKIVDEEMAITLTENVSGTSSTYKFYLNAEIKVFELEKYNFYLK